MRGLRRLLDWIVEGTDERVGPMLVAAALFVAGVIFGALAVDSLGQADRRETLSAVVDLFRSLGNGERPASPLAVLEEAVGEYARTVALFWALGLSVVGSVFVLGETFLRGFATGFAAGFLGAEMGWRGTLYSAAALVPQGLLATPGLVAAAGGALHFALALTGGRARRNHSAFYRELGQYTRWMALSLLALALSALVEAYVTPLFMGLAGRLP